MPEQNSNYPDGACKPVNPTPSGMFGQTDPTTGSVPGSPQVPVPVDAPSS